MRKDIIAAGIVLAIALGTAVALVIRDARQHATVVPVVEPIPEPAAPIAPRRQQPAVPTPAPQAQSAAPRSAPTPKQPAPAPRRNAPTVNQPIDAATARQALEGVGADDQATEVWYQAINDTNLTPNQRKNLIEDLNETGFADPRNLTSADLPLIESRIALLEQIADNAMDDVNAAAFDEAYKDLLNMRARLAAAR